MKLTITLETGEHLTGELYAVEVWHDHSDGVKRAQVQEIDALEINGNVIFPNEEA